ncbi:MAG: M28 family metallopeptidase [Planctomyces sp.]
MVIVLYRKLCVRLLAVVCAVSGFVCATAAEDGPYAGSTAVPQQYAAGFNSITEAESRQILATLVEGEMAGRGTGQEGYLKAARWFAEQLESNGFQPAGDNGTWFQNVPFFRMATVPAESGVKVGDAECIAGLQLGISNWSGRLQSQLPVTLVRLGEKRPEAIEGSLAGRLVVIQGPGRLGAEDEWIVRGKPACLLVVADEGRVRNEAVNRTEQAPAAFPTALVLRSAAGVLAEKCGAGKDVFTAENTKESVVIHCTQVAHVRLAVDLEAIDVPTVVGWYPGTDEQLRSEHICVGAHLDHLGLQRGEIYPGADDNGSGSTAILQVARAIHKGSVKPRRSVLLMAFCAEERGLLGSKHYSANPLRPLSEMVCMLNIDMIGRDEEKPDEPASDNRTSIHLVGSQLESTALHQMILDANKHVGFAFEYDEEKTVAFRSDQASFAEKGIPVAFLFGGFNPHYHKTSDTLEGINFSKIANAARLDYLVLMMAAEHGRFEKDVKAAAEKQQ